MPEAVGFIVALVVHWTFEMDVKLQLSLNLSENGEREKSEN
jgi:hypothetical protein